MKRTLTLLMLVLLALCFPLSAAFAEDVARRAVFGSNTRGSAEYRREVCRALVRRAALKLEEK